jgi:DNA polymerase-3 subunit delta'
MTCGCVWDELIGQSKAAGYLSSAVRSGTVVHAYLFVGPPGAGKKSAARALACALFCGDEACGSCAICRRIKKGVHPDVHVITPEGAASYMVEQIRDITHDVHLRPVEADRKVYILESADSLNDSSANAFLKTLEEPPDDVLIVLLAPSFDSVLPTIASRCQIVRFARIPPETAEAILVERTGAAPWEARAALAATGGVMTRAREFLNSPTRRDARARMLGTLKDLPVMDEFDVLQAARSILTAAKAPLEELKALQAEEIRTREEFLGSSSGKTLEERHKRELTAREREGVAEVLNIAESWLRDCLTISQGVGDLAANSDVVDAMEEVGAVITPGAAVRALDAVNETRRRISYNVSPQLAVEAMLFDLWEVLQCPR